jgi:hypothetical protein
MPGAVDPHTSAGAKLRGAQKLEVFEKLDESGAQSDRPLLARCPTFSAGARPRTAELEDAGHKLRRVKRALASQRARRMFGLAASLAATTAPCGFVGP